MIRTRLACLLPIAAAVAFCTWQGQHFHGMATHEYLMAREFREDSLLYSSIVGVYLGIASAFTAMIMLCAMLTITFIALLYKLHQQEERITRLESERGRQEERIALLESERRRREDAAL